MSVVANVAINVDSRNAVSKLRQVQQGAQATQRATTDLTTALTRQSGAFSKLQAGAADLAGVRLTAQAALVPLRGRMHGIAVTLQPAAAASLLGVPAAEIVGAAVSMQDLSRHGGDLLHLLTGLPDDAARVEALQNALARHLHPTAPTTLPAPPPRAPRWSQGTDPLPRWQAAVLPPQWDQAAQAPPCYAGELIARAPSTAGPL